MEEAIDIDEPVDAEVAEEEAETQLEIEEEEGRCRFSIQLLSLLIPVTPPPFFFFPTILDAGTGTQEMMEPEEVSQQGNCVNIRYFLHL